MRSPFNQVTIFQRDSVRQCSVDPVNELENEQSGKKGKEWQVSVSFPTRWESHGKDGSEEGGIASGK